MTRDLSCPVYGDLEPEVCEEIKVRLGLRSDRDLLRLALWHLTQHAEVDAPIECFRLLDSPPAAIQTTDAGDLSTLPLFESEP